MKFATVEKESALSIQSILATPEKKNEIIFQQTNHLIKSLKYLWMGLNQLGSQKLERVPEPIAVMNDEQSVNDFDQLVRTQTYCMYSYLLDLCHRLQKNGIETKKMRALDIACGPGQLSMKLSEILEYKNVWGIDLSEKMLDRAKENSQNVKNSIRFLKMDASKLEFENDFFDLSVFFQSAHHFDSLYQINMIIQETERVTNPNGAIVIGDLCRLRTKENAKRFVKTACSHYLELGLESLYEDSVNSIHAAWTQEELISTIPLNTKREWFSFKLWPVSAYCFLVSPGKNNSNAFLNDKSFRAEQILPKSLVPEYTQLLFSAKMGEKFRRKII